jgi:hypothetical protein
MDPIAEVLYELEASNDPIYYKAMAGWAETREEREFYLAKFQELENDRLRH